MAVPLQHCTKQKQRSVVRCLFSEGVKPIEIHRRMRIQYGDKCMSRTQVCEWTDKFKNSVTSVEDSPHPGPAFTAVTEDNIAAVENVIRENWRITIMEVASLLDISVGSAHHIIHDELKFRKLCARWVPKRLTPEMKERRVDACQELLCQYEADGEAFLQSIITGDDCWVHFYEPERKWQSMEWCHTSSLKPKKVRVQRSAGKVMLTFFWDYKGPILEHYMPRGSTVTSATYSNLLRENLKPAIRQNGAGCWRQECFSSTTMRSHILLQQHCRLLRSCGLSASHTLRTHPTPSCRIFTSLVHWRMRWVERSSGTTTRFGRRCMSGCPPGRKNSFPAESTHLSRAGISALN